MVSRQRSTDRLAHSQSQPSTDILTTHHLSRRERRQQKQQRLAERIFAVFFFLIVSTTTGYLLVRSPWGHGFPLFH